MGGSLGGVLRGTVVQFTPNEGFFVADAFWLPPDGDPIETCTILTTNSNEVVAPYHDRMPVILPPEYYDAWLKPGDADAEGFLPLMVPFPAAEMVAVAANPIVNSPKTDCPECLQAIVV